MAEKKNTKECVKEALARVKKEMAAPRMANSAREQDVNQNAPTHRAGNG
jgi:hypothetical protein